jgi:hypothetical protein
VLLCGVGSRTTSQATHMYTHTMYARMLENTRAHTHTHTHTACTHCTEARLHTHANTHTHQAPKVGVCGDGLCGFDEDSSSVRCCSRPYIHTSIHSSVHVSIHTHIHTHTNTRVRCYSQASYIYQDTFICRYMPHIDKRVIYSSRALHTVIDACIHT